MSEEEDNWGEIFTERIKDNGWVKYYESQQCVRVQEVHKEQRITDITDNTELDEKAAKCEEVTP